VLHAMDRYSSFSFSGQDEDALTFGGSACLFYEWVVFHQIPDRSIIPSYNSSSMIVKSNYLALGYLNIDSDFSGFLHLSGNLSQEAILPTYATFADMLRGRNEIQLQGGDYDLQYVDPTLLVEKSLYFAYQGSDNPSFAMTTSQFVNASLGQTVKSPIRGNEFGLMVNVTLKGNETTLMISGEVDSLQVSFICQSQMLYFKKTGTFSFQTNNQQDDPLYYCFQAKLITMLVRTNDYSPVKVPRSVVIEVDNVSPK